MTTTTVHLDILQRVSAALQSLSTVPAARVHTQRVSPFTGGECPGVNITLGDVRFAPLGDEGTPIGTTLQAAVPVTLEVHSRSTPHTAAVDAAVAEVHAALMADPSLGGVALRLVLKGSRNSAAQGDNDPGHTQLDYEATVVVAERTLAIVTS